MVSAGPAVCLSGCQSVCPSRPPPLPPVPDISSAGQDAPFGSHSFWCPPHTAGGQRPPAAGGKHGRLPDGVRLGAGHAGGRHASSLAVSGLAESEGF